MHLSLTSRAAVRGKSLHNININKKIYYRDFLFLSFRLGHFLFSYTELLESLCTPFLLHCMPPFPQVQCILCSQRPITGIPIEQQKISHLSTNPAHLKPSSPVQKNPSITSSPPRRDIEIIMSNRPPLIRFVICICICICIVCNRPRYRTPNVVDKKKDIRNDK